MTLSVRQLRTGAALAAALVLVTPVVPAIAAPVRQSSSVIDMPAVQSSDIAYRQRRVVRRGGGRNNGAATAAMLGIVALGVGAAIASNNRRDREYIQQPAYGYGYGQPAYAPQYYQAQPQYYQPQPQPQYYQPVQQPVYGGGRPLLNYDSYGRPYYTSPGGGQVHYNQPHHGRNFIGPGARPGQDRY